LRIDPPEIIRIHLYANLWSYFPVFIEEKAEEGKIRDIRTSIPTNSPYPTINCE
jgi:hypothetical protein